MRSGLHMWPRHLWTGQSRSSVEEFSFLWWNQNSMSNFWFSVTNNVSTRNFLCHLRRSFSGQSLHVRPWQYLYLRIVNLSPVAIHSATWSQHCIYNQGVVHSSIHGVLSPQYCLLNERFYFLLHRPPQTASITPSPRLIRLQCDLVVLFLPFLCPRWVYTCCACLE